MSLTIITLKNSTPSLRGDLSKWMQEIATGVYVGNFNSRIREYLWERVIKNVGTGEAALSYACRNELGYNFKTYNTKRQVIEYDGIPLVIYPNADEGIYEREAKRGFSNASRYNKQRKLAVARNKQNKAALNYIVIDLETNGINFAENSIVEMGAVKVLDGRLTEFNKLIKINNNLPKNIVEMTGITDNLLKEHGCNLEDALHELLKFIGNDIIVGYNVDFDINFINFSLKKIGKQELRNNVIDLLPIVKKEDMYLKNYKLETVLNFYGIKGKVIHRALSDARQIFELSKKLNEFCLHFA